MYVLPPFHYCGRVTEMETATPVGVSPRAPPFACMLSRPPGGRIEVFRTTVSLKTSYTNRLLCVKTCSKHLRSCSNSKVDPSSAHTQVRISHTHASTTNAHVRRPLSAQRSNRTTCRTSACASRSERIRTAKDHAKPTQQLRMRRPDVLRPHARREHRKAPRSAPP